MPKNDSKAISAVGVSGPLSSGPSASPTFTSSQCRSVARVCRRYSSWKRAMSSGVHWASAISPYFFFSRVLLRSMRIQVSLRSPTRRPSWS